MSSPKAKPALKKVHYERGTKPGHTSPRSPRSHSSSHTSDELDSGFGSSSSSSSSNTASLGETAPKTTRLSASDIHTQRSILASCQEALDAANDKIRMLEAVNGKLNAQLLDSNKANRVLKREKRELEDEVEGLRDELRERDLSDGERKARRDRKKREEKEKEKERERRASATNINTNINSSTGSGSSSMPPRVVNNNNVDYNIRPGLERRMSSYRDQLPVVTQSPMNQSPNPFTPMSERPAVTYPPGPQIIYAPKTNTYPSGPVFAHAPPQGPRATVPNDGRYHLTPI